MKIDVPGWRLGVTGLTLVLAVVLGVAGRLLAAPRDAGASTVAAMASPTMTQPPPAAPLAASPLLPAMGAGGKSLREPAVYASHHGVLSVTLVASERQVTIAGRTVLAKVYNGSFMAPTLMISPGDVVRVKLVNDLDEPTNLHFHGLEVSPSGHGDNIFVSVDPGQSFQYSFHLPRTAAPGTSWYHSHEMVPMAEMGRFSQTASEEQVFDGLSGLIEVKGLTQDLPRALRNLPQRYLALRDVQLAGGQIVSSDINSDRKTARLVDGQYDPAITIAPGQTELWHLANIGADIFYNLALPGHSFEVIAQDGHPVIHPQKSATLVLPPGKRYDVLVGGVRPGVTSLRTLDYNDGDDHYPNTRLAKVVTAGRARRAATTPSVISWGSVNLARDRVSRRRTVVFSENKAGTRFFIDGQSYDPSKINFRARLGTVEEWTVVNHTDEIHPFHMHTFSMQEISSNGVPVAFNGYQDEILLPPRGHIVMRVNFSDWTGITVFHCHILAHEDAGMMANIEVSR